MRSLGRSSAEREVADLLPIEADPVDAQRVLDQVPYWFHTFALNRSEGIYTPGTARDHRYRVPAIPGDFSGLRVLDVGAFDGFYAFLAEARGATGGRGRQRAVRRLGSRPMGRRAGGRRGFPRDHEPARLAGRVPEARRFRARPPRAASTSSSAAASCTGSRRRRRLLEVLRRRIAGRGRVLLETHGVFGDSHDGDPVHRYEPRRGLPRTTTTCTGGSPTEGSTCSPERRARLGSSQFDAPMIDGHPRIIGTLRDLVTRPARTWRSALSQDVHALFAGG